VESAKMTRFHHPVFVYMKYDAPCLVARNNQVNPLKVSKRWRQFVRERKAINYQSNKHKFDDLSKLAIMHANDY